MKKNTLFVIVFAFFIQFEKLKAQSNLVTKGKSVTLTYLNGDGKTNQTQALQNAIDSCGVAGGGTLVIPKGTFLISPIFLRSNVHLYLDAQSILLGNPNMTVYTINDTLRHLINGDSLHNVAILGKGTIDGNGSVWWAAYNADNTIKRARMIYVNRIVNFTIDGVTLKNASSFHVKFNQCKYVTVNGITVTSPSTSPNTDGVDPANSKHVYITNCTIGTGDDNIAIKSGRVTTNGQVLLGTPAGGVKTLEGICEDIHISNCTFLAGHGLSIGSETNCGLKDIFVNNCTFTGTDNGIRIKSAPGLGGDMQNLRYRNIKMTNVPNPLIITFTYSSSSGTYPDTPSVNGFYIDSLVATGATSAGSLVGLSNRILQNISLSNVNISAKTGLKITDAAKVTLCNVVITPTSGSSLILSNVKYSANTTSINTLNASLLNLKSVALSWSVGCPQTITLGIFRSSDGIFYTKVSQLSGTSSLTQFQYTDNLASNVTKLYYKIGAFQTGKTDTTWSAIAIVNGIVTGDNDIVFEEEALKFYPNPAKDQLYISYSKKERNSTLSVLSIDGQLLKKVILEQGVSETELNISNLQQGAYFLIVEQNSKKKVEKFFKN